jgi:hypothetical protein
MTQVILKKGLITQLLVLNVLCKAFIILYFQMIIIVLRHDFYWNIDKLSNKKVKQWGEIDDFRSR